MKCLSTMTKTGKPCNNKRINCRWHGVDIIAMTVALNESIETAGTHERFAFRLPWPFRRKGKK